MDCIENLEENEDNVTKKEIANNKNNIKDKENFESFEYPKNNNNDNNKIIFIINKEIEEKKNITNHARNKYSKKGNDNESVRPLFLYIFIYKNNRKE